MKHAKLWKRILHEGVYFPFGEPEAYKARAGMSVAKSAAMDIITAPIVLAKWDNSRIPDHHEDDFLDDSALAQFNGIAPPFPATWLEYTDRDGDLGGHLVRFEAAGPSRWRVSAMGCVACPYTEPRINGFIQFDIQDGAFDTGTLTYGISPFRCPTHPHYGLEEVFRESTVHLHVVAANTILATLMLLGCKNVSLEPRDNDPKQTRIATKRHGPNAHGYRYHVLVVRPAGSRSDAPAQEIGNMPRHVCRGHFAEYGPEYGKGLLFGKYAGRFYVPPHVKGKAENGVVEKDYAIAG